jgi:uncharacterized membrane protein YfcA
MVGAASGMIAGMIGFAGGIVVVPALTWMFGIGALHDAIIVSWFAVLFNSAVAALRQYQVRLPEERAAILACSRYYLVGAMLVVPIAAIALNTAKHLVTPQIVGVLYVCLALGMLMPVHEMNAAAKPRPWLETISGGIIGGVSAVIGVGGGTYTIAYFVYVAKLRFQDAIAVANLNGAIIGTLSVAGYVLSLMVPSGDEAVSSSPISAFGMNILIMGGAAFAPLGVRLSRRMPTKILRRLLVLAILVSALRMLAI